METRSQKKRKIKDSAIGESLSDTYEPESRQISIESNTRYQLNNRRSNDLECDDDIEDDTSHYDDDDDDEEDVYNDRDEGEDDDDDEDEEDDDDEEIDDDEEEDEEQVEEVNNSWSDACPELIPLEFEGVIGPTFERLRSPLDYFRKLFSEDLFDLLLRETIKYAQRTKPNFTLNIVELEGFLGVTMIMSMIRVPSIEDYWSHDDWFGQKQVKSVFVRRRYRQILSALHLVDKDSQTCIRSSPEYDRLHNTRPMINILKNNFRDSFSLGCRLSFDEFMIKFKGRSSLKQYQPLKPIKRGYKGWELCDTSSAYAYDFDIYEGALKNQTPDQITLKKELGCGGSALWELTSGLNDNHKLFFDSYFNSIALLHKLKTRNIYACGTIMSNRKGIPKDYPKNRQMKRGDSVTKHQNGVYVTKWMDKKPVMFASNYYIDEIETINRRNKDRSITAINSPNCAIEYTKNMGGVDRSNRSVQVYSRKRWSRKHNWHRIFFHLLDLAVTNSFILYKWHRTNDQNKYQGISLKTFKKRLADQLVKNQKLSELCRRQGRREMRTIDNSHPLRYRNIFHQLGYEPDMTKRKNCWYCYNVRNKQTIKTYYSCKTCKVPLCINERDCFNKFHAE